MAGPLPISLPILAAPLGRTGSAMSALKASPPLNSKVIDGSSGPRHVPAAEKQKSVSKELVALSGNAGGCFDAKADAYRG
jgi:hypothetical protein